MTTPSPANDGELEKLIERNILVDLRSMNTDPEYNEATMELTHLKKDIAAYTAQAERKARIDELKREDNTFPNWWVTGQSEYSASDMKKLGDYHVKRIAELERESDD